MHDLTKNPRFLQMAALFAALCLLFTACGGEKAPVSVVEDSASSFGSEVEITGDSPLTFSGSTSVFAMPFNTGYGWDPYECASMENRAVLQLIYQGLFTNTPEFSAEPVLCSSYEVSENGLLYTIKVSKHATFSNGDSVTADDVVYSMGLAEDSTMYKSRFDHIAAYEAVGKRTIEIRMVEADDRLFSLLDFPIVPDLSGSSSFMGTGPFVRASSSSLIKNENWWQDPSTVQFDQVKLIPSNSAEATRDSFEIDQVHLIFNDPVSDSAATYHCDYELWSSGGTTLQYIGFNLDHGIFQDQTVRSAVLRAIDRSYIADNIYHNHAYAAELPVSPITDMYDESLALEYSYDPETALTLLLSSSSFKLPADSPLRHGYAAAVAAAEKAQQEAEANGTTDDPNAENAENANNPETAENPLDPESQENPENQNNPDDGRITTNGQMNYNRIRLILCKGNELRSQSAAKIAENLNSVGFTVNVVEYEQNEFFYQMLNFPEEWDLYLGEATLPPDFDIASVASSGGSFNYGHIPYDDTYYALYRKAMENSGNRYDLYKYILDCAYICPVLIENNAVYTTRGVFSNLNPANENVFYGIGNITVNR